MERKADKGRTAREAERVFRPGRPISLEAWNRFMQSRSWEEAPLIFGTSFTAGSGNTVLAETIGAAAGPARGRKHAFFSAGIEADGMIFADEVDKNSLLRILAGEAVRWQVPVADFVLTDDRLCLVICKEGNKGLDPMLQRWYEYALTEFMYCMRRRYLDYYQDRKNLACPFSLGNNIRTYPDAAAALEECCRIHYLPLEQGCVDDIKKYWFSGYISSRGRFAWNFMDPTGLLRELGRRPATSLRHYESAHRMYLNKLLMERKKP